jgi:hypothetical protein
VRTRDRRLELCARRFSAWRARFLACGELAKGYTSIGVKKSGGAIIHIAYPLVNRRLTGLATLS